MEMVAQAVLWELVCEELSSHLGVQVEEFSSEGRGCRNPVENVAEKLVDSGSGAQNSYCGQCCLRCDVSFACLLLFNSAPSYISCQLEGYLVVFVRLLMVVQI